MGPLDWDQLGGRFIAALAEAVGAPLVPLPWPDLNEDEVSGLIEQYARRNGWSIAEVRGAADRF